MSGNGRGGRSLSVSESFGFAKRYTPRHDLWRSREKQERQSFARWSIIRFLVDRREELGHRCGGRASTGIFSYLTARLIANVIPEIPYVPSHVYVWRVAPFDAWTGFYCNGTHWPIRP